MSDSIRPRIIRETYKGKTMKSSVSMVVKSTVSTAIMALVAMSGSSYSQAIIEKSGTCPTFTRYIAPTNENWSGFPNKPATNFVSSCASSGSSTCTIQNPLTPAQSINCLQVPTGLKAQILASELTPGTNSTVKLAYLMHYTFDERGRVWAVDTRDYPAYHSDTGAPFSNPPTGTARLTNGRSRIVILEDTNGDGAHDHFKVFYTGLVIPTSIEIVKNGVIVTVPPYIYYISKSSTNPDTAGPGQTVVTGMGSSSANFDSHFQNNSLTRGLDNYIYGHQGSTGCDGAVVGSNASVSCGGGNIWRFKSTIIGADTNHFEIHSNNGPSNSHGIGQMEDGQWFKSGATGTSHNNHQVRHGQAAVNIETNNTYYLLTRDRYTWEGSNSQTTSGFNSTTTSATSGHDFYTARLLPQKYWNRFSITCEGLSALCNMDSMVLSGSTWSAVRMPGPTRSNLFGSTDAWSAPLKARTGPDGALWVNDWYNYLFLHNPHSPSTNGAWQSHLRGKSRTRLYRILPAEGNLDPVLDLTNASDSVLVATLFNRNFFWRLQAQRLLIERGTNASVLNMLEGILTSHRSVDAVGIDGPAIHALWTLHGLREFKLDSARWNPKLRNLLLHPAWTVRRNVILAMPPSAISAQSIGDMCAVNDVHAHVRVQALQNLVRMPVATGGPLVSLDGLRSGDTHIGSAYTAAGTTKVGTATGSARPTTCPAYMDTTAYTAGYPGTVGIHQGFTIGTQASRTILFKVRANSFTPTATSTLVSGNLVVSDLRGHVVFRSTYNKSTGAWSQSSASNMVHPFYFYTFKGVNGATYNGRIAMDPTY
jgi:putative membrane-bound dehydrogenase-like protein